MTQIDLILRQLQDLYNKCIGSCGAKWAKEIQKLIQTQKEENETRNK